MRNKFNFSMLFLACILVLFLCENNLPDQDSTNITLAGGTPKKMILVWKRSDPVILSTNMDSIFREQDKKNEYNTLRVSSKDYLGNLGCGFKLNNKYPIENPQNITFPIVDILKIYANDNTNISFGDLLTTDGKYFAFAKNDYYYANSTMPKTTKSVSSFGIGGLISAGVDVTYKDVF